jgi:hypothetical protein
MKNFHLQTLPVWSEQNMCQQTLTIIQQPFQSLKHNLEKKEVMSWVELILRSYDLVAY